jgi:SAM-dependent methyltransferase
MPNLPQSEWTSEPFRHGTEAEFARVRELFIRVGYTEAGISARAGLATIHQLGSAEERGELLKGTVDALTLLLHLFCDGEYIRWETVRAFLDATDIEALKALGLLRSAPGSPDLCAASIALYPLQGVYVAGDRHLSVAGTRAQAPADVVYSALTPEAARFLRFLPRDRRRDMLDLCSGTGVAALIGASRFADHAWAVDITERSTRFAKFNVALNALANVTVLEGDLYAPVAGRQFDLIVAHPPYVPALETQYIYRDGGMDGEEVTRRILAGLSAHLRPGGQLCCNCLLTERAGQSLEDRVREMLGRDAGEFDVVIAQWATQELAPDYPRLVREGHDLEAQTRRVLTLARLGVEKLVFVALIVQRRAAERPVITTRRLVSPHTGAADLQWVLRWLVANADGNPASLRRLLDSRPRASPRTELRSRSVLRDGEWVLEDCALVTEAPFAVQAACPPWYPMLLARCDGRISAREHLQYLRETELAPEDAPPDAFASMIRQLVDSGFVEIEEHPLPDATMMRP